MSLLISSAMLQETMMNILTRIYLRRKIRALLGTTPRMPERYKVLFKEMPGLLDLCPLGRDLVKESYKYNELLTIVRRIDDKLIGREAMFRSDHLYLTDAKGHLLGVANPPPPAKPVDAEEAIYVKLGLHDQSVYAEHALRVLLTLPEPQKVKCIVKVELMRGHVFLQVFKMPKNESPIEFARRILAPCDIAHQKTLELQKKRIQDEAGEVLKALRD
jgi:hypothetical protein